MSAKDLSYYVGLPYRIEIQPIPENKGGGYEASIPELGRYAVCADGDTVEGALQSLEAIKRERLSAYLEEGYTIPEPELDEEVHSGKFVLRIPKYLHRELARRAKENGVSLNQFISSLLSRELLREKLESELAEVKQELQSVRACISESKRGADFDRKKRSEGQSVSGIRKMR